jgi:hypothetical protein
MGWLNGHYNGHKHSHIDPATGRNKRDNTRRQDLSQSPRRQNGRIADRKASADKMAIERYLRKRGR